MKPHDGPAEFAEEAYGFRWGAAEVARIFSHKGGVLLSIKTKRGHVEAWVTRTGKIVIRTDGFVTVGKPPR